VKFFVFPVPAAKNSAFQKKPFPPTNAKAASITKNNAPLKSTVTKAPVKATFNLKTAPAAPVKKVASKALPVVSKKPSLPVKNTVLSKTTMKPLTKVSTKAVVKETVTPEFRQQSTAPARVASWFVFSAFLYYLFTS
jgi:hypothetical protein